MLLVLAGVSFLFIPVLWLASGDMLFIFLPLPVAILCAVGAAKTFKWRHQKLNLTGEEPAAQNIEYFAGFSFMLVPVFLPTVFGGVWALVSVYGVLLLFVPAAFFVFGYRDRRRLIEKADR